MLRSILAPALLIVAGGLSLGLSGGQIVRCIRRRRSDDVTIVGWLCGAASQGCLVIVVVITNSSFWLALWEGAGMLEYLLAAWVAWWYRTAAAEVSLNPPASPVDGYSPD
jgi:hypothetical protein